MSGIPLVCCWLLPIIKNSLTLHCGDALISLLSSNYQALKILVLQLKRFLVDDYKYFEKYLDILKICHNVMSYSDIEKSIENIRRAKLLGVLDVKTSILQLVLGRIRKLPKEDKLDLAKALTKAKVASQRRISEITGVHRNTIRKITVAK